MKRKSMVTYFGATVICGVRMCAIQLKKSKLWYNITPQKKEGMTQ